MSKISYLEAFKIKWSYPFSRFLVLDYLWHYYSISLQNLQTQPINRWDQNNDFKKFLFTIPNDQVIISFIQIHSYLISVTICRFLLRHKVSQIKTETPGGILMWVKYESRLVNQLINLLISQATERFTIDFHYYLILKDGVQRT